MPEKAAIEQHPDTPFLLLDRAMAQHNIERMQSHLAGLGVPLRPHLKTSKSLDVARMMFPDAPGPITVSTLAEAEYFADAGYVDILYAVGITPRKLDHVAALRRRGVDLTILVDCPGQAQALGEFCQRNGLDIPTLVEIDCDGHRGGIKPGDPDLITVANTVAAGGATVRGVLTHAGESYFCYTEPERVIAAENERRAAVTAAQALRKAGHAAPIVSVGSTPTALAARDLDGVTEVRAGNFVFFDLVMAGIGVCDVDDIAISVVTTVIGHRHDKGWIMTDSGWTALSSDQGTAAQETNQHFGLVATRDGEIIPDLLVMDVTQEHGVLAMRKGSQATLPDLPVGTELRILPVHACATATQHAAYEVVNGRDGNIEARWTRIRGW